MARLARLVLPDFPHHISHLRAAVPYIERNPVRATLVTSPADWPWSSAAAHLASADDGLVTVAPMMKLVRDWNRYLADRDDAALQKTLRRHESTGRPLGEDRFVARLEALVGRPLAPQKRGPKPKSKRGREAN